MIESASWRNNPYFTLREEFIIGSEFVSPFSATNEPVDPKYHTHKFRYSYGFMGSSGYGHYIMIVSNEADAIYSSSLIPDPHVDEDCKSSLRVYMTDVKKIQEFAKLKVKFGE